MRDLSGWLGAAFLLAGSAAFGEPVDYERDVKPLLKARCYACHGALKQESDLRVDTGANLRQGGDSGAAVSPGLPEKSLLLERISAPDLSDRMPPEGEALTAKQIQQIKDWISQGATSPADEQPEADPRAHWAFQPPKRPKVPVVGNPAWVINPIDAFIAQEHARVGLSPQSPVPNELLLRRVYLDLIGLPPTRAELRAFLADERPEAYERAVEELLASPRYGERWGRHWMDVWRYSDWYGRRMVPDVWNSAPQIWRWRDWIVRSLNEDKGYDRMLLEMLAADEIAPEQAKANHATGYLVRNWYALNPNDWMRSNVEHTGKAFLGLTFNCAHCHDHKYDPITQDDYFRFRAFFEPIGIRQDRVPGEADPGLFQEYNYSTLRKIVRLGSVRIYDKTPEAPTWFYTGGDERNRVTERGSMPPGVPGFLTTSPLKIEPIELPPRAWYPGLRPEIQETILAEQRAALAAVSTQLAMASPAVDAALPALREQEAKAEAELAQAVNEAEQAGHLGALSGRQSLVLDATTGRRLVQNGLSNLKSLPDGTTLTFQLRILHDTHVNFQLAKDHVKGLTAGYVGFDQGRILSYRPGSFAEFEAGRYDFAAGQRHFVVSLTLEPAQDRCLLTVRALSNQAETVLVNNLPVALNGWNPVGDPTKAISFDAHAGSVAVIDDVALTAPTAAGTAGPSASLLALFDFEPPTYVEGRDVIGHDGWLGSSFSQAPATSVVSLSLGNEALLEVSRKLQAARAAVEAEELKRKSLTAQQEAAAAKLASVRARIAADNAKHGNATEAEVDNAFRTANELLGRSVIESAEADVLSKRQALAAAEAKPASDANRAKEITTAQQLLTPAQTALKQAQAALAKAGVPATYTPFTPIYPKTSTGRRKALAEWIANRQNPLTARVAVNHAWLRHFHSPLVATVYDFGLNGQPPTHPELLDWLAVELMESGWSLKHLHRLIVTSNAYRQGSGAAGNDPRLKIDPENKRLWRMNAGRMEAEVVRDSLLYCTQQLDSQMGGQELENSLALTTYRRTIYYSCHPELDGKNPLGALFDAPEPAECYRRTRSVLPQQALALTNSELVHLLSGTLAESLWQSLTPDEQTDPRAFVTAAFEQILSRAPTTAEEHRCLDYLSVNQNSSRARESLVRVILNHNDFIAIR